MRALVVQFGGDVAGRNGEIRLNVVFAEIVEVDGGMGLVLDFDDGIVRGQRLGYLQTVLCAICRFVRAHVSRRTHCQIFFLAGFNHCSLVFWQQGRRHKSDGRGGAAVR